jgi:hypothetical protein
MLFRFGTCDTFGFWGVAIHIEAVDHVSIEEPLETSVHDVSKMHHVSQLMGVPVAMKALGTSFGCQ